MTDYAALRQKALTAVKKLSGAGTVVGAGYCLRETRKLYPIGSGAGSAIIAWNQIAQGDKHSGKTPPAGVPVFWAIGKYGHVAISAGNGQVWSTDILRKGKWDLVSIAYLTNRWNARYLGWSETLNGVRVISDKEAG